MKVSELDTKIDLCVKEESNGPVKNLQPNYTTYKSMIWAKKVKLVGQESIKLGLEHNIVPVNFITRLRKDITEDMYIKHDNTIYKIIGFSELKKDTNFMLISTVKKQV